MASDIMTTADYNDLYIKISEDGKPSDNDIKVENLTVTLEDYKESTYCPEVENHTWYVKYADMVPHWTHNCNHPKSSSIDLSRVSHLITELHWEEHTLVGQMEIFLSNKFIQDGTVCTCGDLGCQSYHTRLQNRSFVKGWSDLSRILWEQRLLVMIMS